MTEELAGNKKRGFASTLIPLAVWILFVLNLIPTAYWMTLVSLSKWSAFGVGAFAVFTSAIMIFGRRVNPEIRIALLVSVLLRLPFSCVCMVAYLFFDLWVPAGLAATFDVLFLLPIAVFSEVFDLSLASKFGEFAMGFSVSLTGFSAFLLAGHVARVVWRSIFDRRRGE